MGDFLSKLFVDPTVLPGGENCGGNSSIFNYDKALFGGDVMDPLNCASTGFGFIQVLFLLLVYAYILSWGSNLISDGSELLLLVPSLRDIVGSVVLPILGAVPDGAIVLFSGLGADAQKQLSVGIGGLAGSTIMLLTIPWFLSVTAGRVHLDSKGEPIYKKPRGAPATWKKLDPTQPFRKAVFSTGIGCLPEIATMGKIMFVTSLCYFFIQIPAFVEMHKHGQNSTRLDADGERYWALAGLLLCVICFVGYLVYQVKFANVDDAVEAATRNAIGLRLVSLSGVFGMEIEGIIRDADEEALHLLHENKKLRDTLYGFYKKYDRNGDGQIDADELRLLFIDLNENLTPEEFKNMMTQMDKDKSGYIDFDEFTEAMHGYIRDSVKEKRTAKHVAAVGSVNQEGEGQGEEGEEEGEDEEEMPEEFEKLTPAQQQRAIKLRAAWMMGLGTFVVLLFSDPMVDVLSDVGTRIGIAPFYVSFVLAPMASNASELIAAYNYASKKTQKTASISLSTLEGASIMNNTFCLGIFLLLIFAKNLSWEFSAETIAIFIIQVVMVYFAHKKVQRWFDAYLVIMLYPLSLVLVALLEGPGGLE